MRTFKMHRGNDESGVSGTGVVLEGVVFPDGKVAVQWVVERTSVGIYDNYGDFEAIHILSHPTNETKVIFRDGTTKEY